jgi:hypothetical protein
MIRRIFGSKREKVAGGWRLLRNKKLRNLYASPNIIRVIKAGRMRWVGHVERMERRARRTKFWPENRKGRDHAEGLRVRGCIQKFPDWPPGARTANGIALCH